MDHLPVNSYHSSIQTRNVFMYSVLIRAENAPDWCGSVWPSVK